MLLTLVSTFKEALVCQRYSDDDDVKTEVMQWLAL